MHPKHFTTCGYCGKLGYRNRTEAKQAIKQLHPDQKMSTYQCRHTPDSITAYWHIGHLPANVKAGDVDRSRIPPKEKK